MHARVRWMQFYEISISCQLFDPMLKSHPGGTGAGVRLFSRVCFGQNTGGPADVRRSGYDIIIISISTSLHFGSHFSFLLQLSTSASTSASTSTSASSAVDIGMVSDPVPTVIPAGMDGRWWIGGRTWLTRGQTAMIGDDAWVANNTPDQHYFTAIRCNCRVPLPHPDLPL
jgi:hypothetical protein